MNEVIRYLSFALLIILNQILLSTNFWSVFPDIFLVHTLIFVTFIKKIPNIYIFILKGFLIDLFFSNISTPYTLTYTLIGLYLNFSNLRWIQRSLLEQMILIISVSFSLNVLLFALNSFSDDMIVRIILNPLLNSIIWAIIFLNQKQKWLKNI
jgi:rod shape-determining protein MreD